MVFVQHIEYRLIETEKDRLACYTRYQRFPFDEDKIDSGELAEYMVVVAVKLDFCLQESFSN